MLKDVEGYKGGLSLRVPSRDTSGKETRISLV